jgi:hypothetical protein
VARAAGSDDARLHKAYYLEKQSHDYSGAKALYEQVAGDADGSVAVQARRGAERCRDHLAAEDFARLMPPETLFFAEVKRPGQIIEKVAGMIGLTGDDMRAVLDKRPNVDSKSPVNIPQHIIISPSLFEALSSFGGIAVGVTKFNPEDDGAPTGVMVLHHGDYAALKGILETAFQFSPTAQKIADLPTFGTTLPDMGNLTGVLTEALLIVGNNRELVEGSVGRLLDEKKPSLTSRDDRKELGEQRKNTTIFAYCDLQAVVKIAAEQAKGDSEFAAINALADLRSLQYASGSLAIHEGELSIQFAVQMTEDQHSLVYNMMRLPPMTRKCLKMVPADAAGFIGFGLNPAWANAAATAMQPEKGKTAVTGLDIGRELFGNIQELCAFIMPGGSGSDDGSSRMPNAALVMSVNDSARSIALWDQLLSIPGLVTGDQPLSSKPIQIGDIEAKTYSLPEVGKLYVSRVGGSILVATSRAAVRAAGQAHQGGKSILDDAVIGKALERMPADSSILAVGHLGRLTKVAARENPGMAMAAGPAADLMSKTIAWVGVGQSPDRFTVRIAVSGLPNVNEALARFGPMLNGFTQMMGHDDGDHERKADRPKKKKSKSKRSREQEVQ